MNKKMPSINKTENSNFVQKILEDKDIHSIWENHFKEEENSVDSILLTNDKPKPLPKDQPFLKYSLSEKRLQFSANLDGELNKKSYESTMFQNKLSQTICQYERKVKEISQIVFDTIQSVNQILSYLQLQHTSILNFMENDNEDELSEQVAHSYLEVKFDQILKQLQDYSHVSEFTKHQGELQKEKKKNQSLLAILNKTTEKNEKLKKKIHKLQKEKISLNLELESYRGIIQDSHNMILKLDLNLFTRPELIACMKKLIQRIIAHESKCPFMTHITHQQILNMGSDQVKTLQKSRGKYKDSSPSMSPTKRMSKPPLSPRLAKKY